VTISGKWRVCRLIGCCEGPRRPESAFRISVKQVGSGGGWVITEHIRTVSADRFRRQALEITLSAGELDDVRHLLSQMLIVGSSEGPASA
jgi:hypothetical protein